MREITDAMLLSAYFVLPQLHATIKPGTAMRLELTVVVILVLSADWA
jgi:hypothetical protein